MIIIELESCGVIFAALKILGRQSVVFRNFVFRMYACVLVHPEFKTDTDSFYF